MQRLQEGILGKKGSSSERKRLRDQGKAHCAREEMRKATRNFQESTESGTGKSWAARETAVTWHVISIRADELSDNRCHLTVTLACAPHTWDPSRIKSHQAGGWNSSRQSDSTLSNAM